MEAGLREIDNQPRTRRTNTAEHFDGMDYPLAGNPNIDTIALKPIDADASGQPTNGVAVFDKQ